MQIFIDDIEIRVEKKKIKNLHIYVKSENDILLTAPKYVSNAQIREFVREKEDWIRNSIEKMREKSFNREDVYKTGEILRVWGDLYTLRVQYGSGYALELEDGGEDDGENKGVKFATLTVKESSTDEQIAHFVTEWYRSELTERVNILLPKWEAYTGLKCSSWQSKSMKTRWGTCNTGTKKIWLNVQLAKYPTACLEYVILHELAHTKVPNHGEDFKRILDMYMPEWKMIRKMMRNI